MPIRFDKLHAVFGATFNNRTRKTILISVVQFLFALFLLAGCSVDRQVDFFYVKNAGEVMPVDVRGNASNGTFILLLHGGPGDTAQYYTMMKPFQQLEENYAVIYWDQRAAGNSYGHPSKSSISMDQFVEDTHAVILAVKKRLNVKTIVLLGVSWGGRLGYEYLASSYVDPLVKGWIDVDGLSGYLSTYQASRDWVITTMPNRINDPSIAQSKKDGYQNALNWHQDRPDLGSGGFLDIFGRFMEHARILRVAGLYDYDPDFVTAELGKILGWKTIFFSSIDTLQQLLHATNWHKIWNDSESEVARLLADPAFANISVPTLIINGEHDGAITAALAQTKYNALTSLTATQKSILIYDKSGHDPMIEEPDRFFTDVNGFVAALQ
ncbi:MAG: alpha/beta hydrolase [Gammaproteobacteria bacterium]|nr:alpha/beta hydrolase [Gammaproteobacteria bacterium]